jgi:uncharacterized membrane protein (DUF106 family)
MELLSVALVAAFVITLVMPGGLSFLFMALMGFLRIIRVLFVVGLVFGIINSPQFYLTFGWTPISLMVGRQLYEKQATVMEARKHEKQAMVKEARKHENTRP